MAYPESTCSQDVQRVIEDKCKDQKPQHATYNADDGLHLAKNVVTPDGPWVRPGPARWPRRRSGV